MQLGRNVTAGLASSIWSALVGLLAVPFYIKYLGIEAYGLIGFFVTIQSLLQLLDFGLAPTMNREIARSSETGDWLHAKNLLRSLAVVYWAVAGLIGAALAAVAPLIAEYWLQSKEIPQDVIARAVVLMGLVVACRWPAALYQSALMGAQRLVVSSAISASMLTLGSLGAVGVLALISPTVEAFFAWQAAVGVVYVLTVRWIAWRTLGGADGSKFSTDELKRVWRFSAGMSAIALSAVVFTQLDKVILSKVIELEEFGFYMLATTVVGALYMLVVPIFNAVYPRFTALVAGDRGRELSELYRLGTRALATILFPAAMFISAFSEDLIAVWTGRSDIATNVGPIVTILAIGSALHGVMHFPYALQIAHGMTRLPLTINGILMVILLPMITLLSLTYGAIGGAIAWLTLHVHYLLLGTWLTHRYLLKGTGRTWLQQDVGVPLILSSVVGIFGYHVVHQLEYAGVLNLVFGALLAVFASLTSFLMSRPLREIVWTKLGWKKNMATAGFR